MKATKTVLMTLNNGVLNSVIICVFAFLLASCERSLPESEESKYPKIRFFINLSPASYSLKNKRGFLKSEAGKEIKADSGNAVSVALTFKNLSSKERIHKTINLSSSGSGWMSQSFDAISGSYNLERVIVLDSSNDHVCAVPRNHSSKAGLTQNPLPLTFAVRDDELTTINIEATATGSSTPEDFGYTTFASAEMDFLDFKVNLFLYNKSAKNYQPGSAEMLIKNGGNLIHRSTIDGKDNIVELPDNRGVYNFSVNKTAYRPYEQNKSVDYLKSAGIQEIYLDPPELVRFEEIQSIETDHAKEWEYFNIDGEDYLAVANWKDATYTTYSKVYKWNGYSFQEEQSIATDGAMDVIYFKISQEDYLAITNTQGGVGTAANTKIYKWDGDYFGVDQTIDTICGWELEHFTMEGDSYLAIAHACDISDDVPEIYKWDGDSFEPFQFIPTFGAHDWEYFVINGVSYLAVTNCLDYSNNNRNLDSVIYKWDGDSSFDWHQDIPTSGGADWEYFTIGGESYLAAANSSNGESAHINSVIYKWDGDSFEVFQSLPTIGAAQWNYFAIEGESYLAVSNEQDSQVKPSVTTLNSPIYKWDGDSFEVFQDVTTYAGSGWEYFSIGGEHYLALANATGQSKIYKAVFE